MKTAIMQPTYLPWSGYFDLIDQVNVFVLLDNVQFARRSWQQRNQIRTPKGLEWLTVPVEVRGRYEQLIAEVRIAHDFVGRHLRAIEVNYGRAPFFGAFFPLFSERLRDAAATEWLAALNQQLISWFCEQLGVQTDIVLSSKLGAVGKRSELLANICSAVGANTYLSPPGSVDYLRQDRKCFDAHGIDVLIQQFEHPVYRQVFEPFIPYASIVDILANLGPAAAIDSIRSSRRAPVALETFKPDLADALEHLQHPKAKGA
jgi:hypothetical protein